MTDLKNVKYETTMENYQNEFDKLLSRVEIDMPEEQQISFFLAGLPNEI